MRGGRRLLRRFLPGALVALALAAPAVARAEPPNPSTNLEIGAQPSYCSRPNPPAACALGVIYYLDQARATMGLGPYALPANFLSLTPAEQMFVLANLDRVAYSLPPVEGLNAGLDGAAIRGAQEDLDPEPTEADLGRPLFGYSSNWAGAFASTVEAYFFWMYADGYGSGNLDCKTPSDSGCWGHRQDTLVTATLPEGRADTFLYSMGAALTTDAGGNPSYAMTIAISEAASPPTYYYTWAQAVAEGAGTNPFPAAPAVEEKVQLDVALRGHGSIVTTRSEGADVSCLHSCRRQVPKYEPLTLRAVPARGYRFVGWQGCVTRSRLSCTIEPQADASVSVAFVARRRHHRPRRRHRPRAGARQGVAGRFVSGT